MFALQKKRDVIMKLRPYKKSDAQHIASWINDKETFYLWSAGCLGEYPFSDEVLNAEYDKHDCDDNYFPMTAFDDQGVCGHILLRFTDAEKKIVRFGFVIVDNCRRGRGLGKQMLKLAFKYAFELLKADKVTISVFNSNSSAVKCYKSVGFTPSVGENNESYDIDGERWECTLLEIGKGEYISKYKL